jgi:5-methylcytosine-specific restriction endonuclease McrA
MPNKPPTFRPPGVPVWDSERQRKAAHDQRRPSSQERGYDAQWRKLRDAFAAANPVCSVPGCGRPTEDIDHVKSVRTHPELRLVWANLRALCHPHHSERTAREQGFARKNTG